MSVTYERVNWEDSPSTQTPLNADNLNNMDAGIADLADWVNENEDSLNDSVLIASEFVAMQSYTAGDLLIHDNKLYRVNSDIQPLEWNVSHYTEVKLDKAIHDLAHGIIAKRFVTLNAWERQVGEYVIHGTDLYRVTTANTDMVWDATKYIKVASLGSEVQNLKSTVTNLSSTVSDLGSDVTDLKADLNGMQTATSEDVGKALLAKTVENGRVSEWEFGEAGGADPAVIEQAVTDWLDEHPEATTTVADNSLTEAKFTTELQKKTIKDYVTPEMYGAVGDGTTDDTAAIKAMLASGAMNIVFDKPSYHITDSIDFTTSYTTVWFNNTIINVTYPSGGTTLLYAVGFKAGMMRTIGNLTVSCSRHAYICIWLEHVHSSIFDTFNVSGGIIWGVYLNHKSSGNNTLTFNSIRAQSCGITLSAYANYETTKTLSVKDIDYTDYSYIEDEQKRVIFNGEYAQNAFVIDDSDYSIDGTKSRKIFGSSIDQALTLNDDLSSGVFNVGNYPNINANYVDGDTGRKIAIPIGGGVSFSSAASEGGLKIGRMSITNCSFALRDDFPYGILLGSLMVESCTAMFATRHIVWYGFIGYLYIEGLGLKLSSSSYKNLVFIAKDSNTNLIVAASSVNLSEENSINLGSQGLGTNISSAIFSSLRQISSKNTCYNSSGGTNWGGTLTENSPENIIYNTTGLSAVAKPIELDVSNATDIINKYNYGYSPKKIFVHVAPNGNASLKIGIKANALNLGYSINGAVDNVLTVDGASLGRNFVVTILLFGKVFYITAEPLTFVDNTV